MHVAFADSESVPLCGSRSAVPRHADRYLDSLGMNEVAIGQLGSLFPLAAVPAILIAGNLHQRISAKARSVMYPGMLCISAGGLALLSSLTTASPVIAPTLTAIMFGVAPVRTYFHCLLRD